MPLETKLIALAILVLVATAAGIFWRVNTGKAHRVRSGEQVQLARLEATKDGSAVKAFGKRATFVQFSSEVCSQCRTTARILGEYETKHKDVLHLEVDVTDKLDLAAHFNVLQTPTTLVLDGAGRVRARIGGTPKHGAIQEALESLEIR